jgi:indolepyruvate ferredoxin oxidoreductase beta subunit
VKLDLVLAGVGGQGVVSLGVIVAAAAQREGYTVQLSEVHGMAQRGGSVMATLRIADRSIPGALVPAGTADFVVATEPLEALRYVGLLSPDGVVVTASEPHVNMANYPDGAELMERIQQLPRAIIVDSRRLARQAGGTKSANLVIVGALSRLLPLAVEGIEDFIRERFAAKGPAVVETNLKAFRAGRESAVCGAVA